MKHGRGAVARVFSRVGTMFNHVIANSPIGALFTSYNTCNDFLSRASKRDRVQRGHSHHTVRRAVASAMEDNILTRGIRAILHGVCACTLRTFGLFFMVLAGIFATFYFLSVDSLLGDLTTWSYLLFALIAAAVGFLLLLSDRSIGYLILKSRLCSFFLFSVLGVSDDMARTVEKKGKNHYVVAVLLSAFVAALALLFPPSSLLLMASCLLLTLLICSVPEAGFLLTVVSLPFSGLLVGSNLLTFLLILLSLVGYVGKLLRGNRVLRIEWQDAVVLCFIPLFFTSGFSLSEQSVWQTVLFRVVAVLFYLFAVNVLATPHWLFKCQITFVFSATAAAFTALTRFFIAAVRAGITTVSLVELAPYINIGFDSLAATAYYFVLGFAFALPAVFYTKKGRPIALFSMVLIVMAASLTFVSSAWLALLLIAICFLVLYSRSGFPTALLSGGVGVGVYFLLPHVARERFLGWFADISAPSHLTARAEGKMALGALYNGEGGVSSLLFGVGCDGMNAAYPYLIGGAEFTFEAYNFYTYQLAEGGVFALALPILLFFVLLQNAFSSIRYTKKRENLLFAYTGILLVAATILYGFFHYVWYDEAILFGFFAAIALIGAGLRFDRTRQLLYTDSVNRQGVMQAELNYRSSVAKRKKKEG